jgi:hypothetical protein
MMIIRNNLTKCVITIVYFNRLPRPIWALWFIGPLWGSQQEKEMTMLSPTSSNIAPTRTRNPPARPSRRRVPSAKIIGAAIIALLASGSTFADAAESSSGMARLQHACAVVMGLHQPGELYDTCVRSLNKALSELDRARLASTNRAICAQQRLTPGSPAFAVCVVDAEQSPADVGHYDPIAAVH